MSVYLDKCNRNQGQSRKAIVLRKFSQPPVRLLLEQRRVQVAAGANAFGRSERRRKAKRFLPGAQGKNKAG